MAWENRVQNIMTSKEIRQTIRLAATRRNVVIGAGLLVLIIAASAILIQSAHPEPPAASSSDRPGSQAASGDNTGAKPTSPQAGSPDNTPGTNKPNQGSAQTSTQPPAAPVTGSTASVSITASGFSPANVTVTKGSTVSWTNNDTTDHALDPAPGSEGPHSPLLKPGQSYTYSYAEAGSFKYIDVIKPSDSGTVTVVAE